jgi:hypothetical protein
MQLILKRKRWENMQNVIEKGEKGKLYKNK